MTARLFLVVALLACTTLHSSAAPTTLAIDLLTADPANDVTVDATTVPAIWSTGDASGDEEEQEGGQETQEADSLREGDPCECGREMDDDRGEGDDRRRHPHKHHTGTRGKISKSGSCDCGERPHSRPFGENEFSLHAWAITGMALTGVFAALLLCCCCCRRKKCCKERCGAGNTQCYRQPAPGAQSFTNNAYDMDSGKTAALDITHLPPVYSINFKLQEAGSLA